jgi:outer membrane protein assembly factor BamA
MVGRTENGIEERDVTVNVAEAKRYLLIYGFGYQSSRSDLHVPGLEFFNGARGLVQLTNSNMFGKLYTGSAQFRIGQDELLGQISFQNPRPFGKNYPTLISVFARRLAEKSFLSDRYTALIQTERRISDDTIAYLSYSFERIKNSPPEADVERSRAPVRLGRIGPSFARDTRDNAFEPTTGNLTVGSFSIASSIHHTRRQRTVCEAASGTFALLPDQAIPRHGLFRLRKVGTREPVWRQADVADIGALLCRRVA